MTLLIPVLFFYLLTFFPSFLSLPFYWVVPFFLLLFLCRKKENALVFLLLLFLVLHLGGRAYDETVFASSLDTSSITFVSGKVVSEPSRRKNRGVGYRIRVHAVMDMDGNAYTAKGDLYVISALSDVDFGDEVGLLGTMGEGYFLSSSTELLHRSSWNRVRRRFSSLLLRYLPEGENGNLPALLLSGSSLDGTSTLTDLARNYGLSYILALSGMHLALLTVVLRPILHALGGRRMGEVVVALLLLFFVYTTGWKPSLTRALFLFFLSHFLDTEYSFCFSLVFLLLLFPSSLSDVGTALSFVSLGGILFLSKRMTLPVRLVFPFLLPIWDAIAASASALVFSVPLLVHTFGSWVPGSLLLAFPAGILIALVFYLVMIRIFIPKTDWILNKLYELLPLVPEKHPLFHEEEGFETYWWLLGIAVSLFLLGVLLEHREKLQKAMKNFAESAFALIHLLQEN